MESTNQKIVCLNSYQDDHTNVNRENKLNDQQSENQSFFSKVLLNSRETLKEITHYLNQFNLLFISKLIEFHSILKEKLHVPYPADLIVFLLIGYFLCSILMKMCCKVR